MNSHTTPTPAQKKQLDSYIQLLRQWNTTINLVAPGTLADVEQRHIQDCAQLVPHVAHLPAQKILDVGSGGGLPGLILAILAPQHTYTLSERDQRKSAFLRTAAHQLQLTNVTISAADVKTLTEQYDIITARAFSSLLNILQDTSPLLAPAGHYLLLKGQAIDEELRACETKFHLTTERWPSIVAGNGWVVRLKLNVSAPVPRGTPHL
ncbi:MAG: 16S rRNA (guanine(527)-N(7))-methyltransferase RsmG [Proteobacteria bacterium]|nr:16S rRNA (guanine(527)-N(7))-methyltransferase RsmG [Pseudomonadota bacterium]NBX86723.1 16S rRNA (guanine(527)-N(7))-methyltransferase RsmG [Pseudomonadota bacterium]